MSLIESPKYEILKKEKNIEVRKYTAGIVAEVTLDATDYVDGVNKGFNILADYIFGNNTARGGIPMTTPVTIRGKGRYTVAFTMPSKYTLKTLPAPNNKRVKIVQVKPGNYAAIRFSGFFDNNNFEKHKDELRGWISKNKIKTVGDFIVAGYSPPFTLPFLTRHEVMIRIK